MNRIFLAATALVAFAAAAPAAAQSRYYSNQYGLDTSFDARIGALESRLDAGMRAGTITRREAWSLRRQLSDLRRLEARYSLGGFTRFERDDLQQRLRMVRQDLRVADNGGWDRNDRYSWDDRDWRDNGYYGRGGPELDDWVALRVGERVRGDLGLIPDSYRMRYRDGDGVYYRSDGRAIYEVDARTNTILRVYPMR